MKIIHTCIAITYLLILREMSSYFSRECLRNPSLYLPCASFAVQRKFQEDMDSSPAHSDHRKVFPDMCLCPGLCPCLALFLPMELSIRAWNERTVMLVPVTDAQFHHPPTSPPALSAFPSDSVRKGPCRWPHYQRKVCQWSVKNKHGC